MLWHKYFRQEGLMKGQRIFLNTIIFILSVFYVPAFSESLDKRVIEHTLKNGMKLLLLERHQSPTVATTIMFKVGSVDERQGGQGPHIFLNICFSKGQRCSGQEKRKNPSLIRWMRLLFSLIQRRERVKRLTE